MASTEYNFTINQGDSISLPLYFSDDDGPIDLSGWTVKCEMRPAISSTVIAAEFAFEILNQSTNKGWARIYLTKEQSLAIPVKTDLKNVKRVVTAYASDIVTINTSLQEKRWGQGVINVSPLVSRG